MITLSKFFGGNRRQLEPGIHKGSRSKGMVREARTFLRSILSRYRGDARDPAQATFTPATTTITHPGVVPKVTFCYRVFCWCGYRNFREPGVFGSRVGLTSRDDTIGEKLLVTFVEVNS